MRITVIPEDRTVIVDGIVHNELNLDAIHPIDGERIHAIQWYGDSGEIEYVGSRLNETTDSFSSVQTAYDLWLEKDKYVKKLKEEEELRLEEEKMKFEEAQREKEKLMEEFLKEYN